MKWGVQHVKVTLESDSGETVVIEQSPDGRVKCAPGKAAQTERAANTAPKAAEPEAKAAPKAKSTKPKDAKPEVNKAERTGGTPKVAAASKVKAQATKPRGKGSKKGPLKWVPVKDHDYDGFAAPSGGGQFKVLIAKDTQWALFYELKGTWPKHIGCFRKVDKAKERAQELHDAGWPETEFGPITAGQVASACPAPSGQREADEEMTTTPTTEEKPAPQAEPPAASKTDAERDKELLGSFAAELESVLDEDEDD